MEKYKAWIDRYFDAALSPSEEAEFRRFLATTDDPAFDGVKAVMGYFAVESPMAGRGRFRGRRRLWRGRFFVDLFRAAGLQDGPGRRTDHL